MSDKATALTYDQLTNTEKLYMFEFIFPEAVRLVLKDREITAHTNFVPPELQKERPRAEIIFIPGSGRNIWALINGEKRECAWSGQFLLHIITAADEAIHARYVTKLRSLMHGIGTLVNNTPPMQFHKIQEFFRDAGTSEKIQPEDGAYQTSLAYDIDFSIQANAWAALLNT